MAPSALISAFHKDELLSNINQGLECGATRKKVRSMIKSLSTFPDSNLTALDVSNGYVRRCEDTDNVLTIDQQNFLSQSTELQRRIKFLASQKKAVVVIEVPSHQMCYHSQEILEDELYNI